MAREESLERDRPWPRRAITIPAVLLIAVLVCVALPVLGTLALLVNLAHGRRSVVLRSLLFVAWVLVGEVVGLLGRGRIVARPTAHRARNYALQHRWSVASA